MHVLIQFMFYAYTCMHMKNTTIKTVLIFNIQYNAYTRFLVKLYTSESLKVISIII